MVSIKVYTACHCKKLNLEQRVANQSFRMRKKTDLTLYYIITPFDAFEIPGFENIMENEAFAIKSKCYIFHDRKSCHDLKIAYRVRVNGLREHLP